MSGWLLGAWWAGSLLGCGAVSVTDVTPSEIGWSPPINEHVFAVELDGPAAERVVWQSGSTAVEMDEVAPRRWEVVVPLEPCVEFVEYVYEIAYSNGFSQVVETFPATGTFTRRQVERPLVCTTFREPNGATFVVDTTEDFVDLEPGDGVCEGDGAEGPACSLRAAIMEANESAGHDLIELANARYVLTVDGNEEPDAAADRRGDLDLTDDVTIVGPENAAVSLDRLVDADWLDLLDADGAFPRIDASGIRARALHVRGGQTLVRLSGLAVVGGDTGGGAGRRGGGIYNEGTTTLDRVVLVNNEAASEAGGTDGGGAIANEGTLVGVNVALVGNTVQGFDTVGGALLNEGEAGFDRVLIAGNQSDRGAAILNRGRLSITNGTLLDNGTDTTVSVVRSEGDRLELVHVTLADHALSEAAALLSVRRGEAWLRHSLVVGNAGVLCAEPLLSGGGNVLDGPCSLTSPEGLPPVGDWVDAEVSGVGAFGDHGGFLPTVELLEPGGGGPLAVDPVDKGLLRALPPTDGRGFERASDADGDGQPLPDAGAFEYVP